MRGAPSKLVADPLSLIASAMPPMIFATSCLSQDAHTKTPAAKAAGVFDLPDARDARILARHCKAALLKVPVSSNTITTSSSTPTKPLG